MEDFVPAKKSSSTKKATLTRSISKSSQSSGKSSQSSGRGTKRSTHQTVEKQDDDDGVDDDDDDDDDDEIADWGKGHRRRLR